MLLLRHHTTHSRDQVLISCFTIDPLSLRSLVVLKSMGPSAARPVPYLRSVGTVRLPDGSVIFVSCPDLNSLPVWDFFAFPRWVGRFGLFFCVSFPGLPVWQPADLACPSSTHSLSALFVWAKQKEGIYCKCGTKYADVPSRTAGRLCSHAGICRCRP